MSNEVNKVKITELQIFEQEGQYMIDFRKSMSAPWNTVVARTKEELQEWLMRVVTNSEV